MKVATMFQSCQFWYRLTLNINRFPTCSLLTTLSLHPSGQTQLRSVCLSITFALREPFRASASDRTHAEYQPVPDLQFADDLVASPVGTNAASLGMLINHICASRTFPSFSVRSDSR